jgi:[ribosomal protein S5]-alanine N-acetyltransferase
MDMTTTISTDRLLIERLAEHNHAFILELLNTEGWLTFIGNRNVYSNADAVAYIQKINGNANITYWTATIKNSGIAIGLVTLIQRDYLEHPDIGFAFLPEFANQGYAYEATHAVLLHLVGHNVFSHIAAVTLPDNLSSIKLIERLGLRFEKALEVNKDLLHIYGATAARVILVCGMPSSKYSSPVERKPKLS